MICGWEWYQLAGAGRAIMDRSAHRVSKLLPRPMRAQRHDASNIPEDTERSARRLAHCFCTRARLRKLDRGYLHAVLAAVGPAENQRVGDVRAGLPHLADKKAHHLLSFRRQRMREADQQRIRGDAHGCRHVAETATSYHGQEAALPCQQRMSGDD